MEQRTENERLIVQYLIGDLPEEERKIVEDRYFKDDSFFEEAAIIEEDLIDDYLHGKLTVSEREQFEDHYLASPARRERLEFSRTMMRYITDAPVSDAPLQDAPARRGLRSWFLSLLNGQNRTLQFALGAVVLVIAAAAAWLLYENTRLKGEINDFQAERARFEQKEREMSNQAAEQRERERELTARIESEQSERRQLEQQLAESMPQPPAIFELASTATRSGAAAKSLNIPSATKRVELRLYVEQGDYIAYRAVLQTAEWKKIWSRDGLKASTTSSGKVVTLNLAAELLSGGDYILTLGAKADGSYEDVGEYSFKVVRK